MSPRIPWYVRVYTENQERREALMLKVKAGLVTLVECPYCRFKNDPEAKRCERYHAQLTWVANFRDATMNGSAKQTPVGILGGSWAAAWRVAWSRSRCRRHRIAARKARRGW